MHMEGILKIPSETTKNNPAYSLNRIVFFYLLFLFTNWKTDFCHKFLWIVTLPPALVINAEIRSIQLIAVFLDPHRNRHADLRNLAVITGKSNTGNHFILQLTKADILNILIAADYLRGDFYIHILFCKSLIKEICPCILRLCKGDIP